MKETYENLELTVVHFRTEDIITENTGGNATGEKGPTTPDIEI